MSLPKPQMETFFAALKKTNPQVDAWVEEENNKIAYCESTCGICLGRHSSDPVCHLYVGSVGEAVRWADDVYCHDEPAGSSKAEGS